MRPLILLTLALAVGCASSSTPAPAAAAPAPATPSPELKAALAAPDRSDKDKSQDAQRHPAEVMAFLGIGPGQKVAELGAGGGWTSEVLARAVGPTGTVYSMNPPAFIDFAGPAWNARLATPVMAKTVKVVQEFENPLPPEAKNLDAVVISFIYHDTVNMGVDRDKMNRAIFNALKPGGVYAILDSSARPGTGLQDTKTLHRIDEQTVQVEIERVGFKLAGSSDLLRNPNDPRDWNSSPTAAGEKRGTGDRFVDKFVKP